MQKLKKYSRFINSSFLPNISPPTTLSLTDAQKLLSKIAILSLTSLLLQSYLTEKALAESQDHISRKYLQNPLYRESLALIEAKDYKSAIKKLSLFLEKHELSHEGHFFRGKSYHELNILDKASADYTKAIKLNPSYEEAHNNRGLIYGQLRRFDLATKSFTQAIEINPQLKEAYNNRGVARAATGDKNNAIKDFTKSIELDKNYIEPRLNRSFVLEMQGKLEKACEDWKIASAMGSRDAQIWHKAQCNK